ncbi:hypothetical protein [Streptomyces sp. AK08-02]|uniref:hypothetical protein n=1 Tax=Streptomyces sp. AK08-02 TaxID=3028654 RepID=UPI0029C00301|nr:hypothetical protein [Streptomyces sp. AK08-02]
MPLPETVRCVFVDFLGHDAFEQAELAKGLGRAEQACAGDGIAENHRALTVGRWPVGVRPWPTKATSVRTVLTRLLRLRHGHTRYR